MVAYVVVVLLTLAVAVAVIVVTSRGSEERTTWHTFVADFKAGWHDLRHRDPEPEPVDVPFDELFDAEASPGDDYLHLDELAELIERTGDRAGQLLHHDPSQEVPVQERGPWTVRPRGHHGGRIAGQAHPGSGESSAPRRTSISSPH